jgi:transcriptional regulator with XRE-family HTH domain
MAKPKRQTKYDTHVVPYLDRIPAWRKQGLTEKQVAERLGVGYSTLSVYKNKNVELLEALKKGKEELIEELEDSLYRRAMGFEYEEVDTYIEEFGDVQKVKTKIMKRVALPDTGALAFALKNLAPDKWRDRHDITEFSRQEKVINIIDIPPEDEDEKDQPDEQPPKA